MKKIKTTEISHYEKKLYNYFLKQVENKSHAKDLTQEILLKLWSNRDKMSHIRNLDKYIFTMAKNQTIDFYRKKNEITISIEETPMISCSQSPNAILNLIEEDLKSKLQILLNTLSPRQKEIFILSRINGLSHDEISFQLNISNKTVRNHLFEALKYLREKF